ncbi:hypothetical protein LTR01_008964 [Friedmanniomyces endolithicus]|nr:hypothetical protein LTR01_008964 [Friedmanniomyces endolithicus]KAK0822816.1 hypothetical protein LTR73_009013 [Friedmanniomyces endolithicus]
MSLRQQPTSGAEDTYNDGHELAESELYRHDHEHDGTRNRYRKDVDAEEHGISIPATSKHAEQTVAPFLTKHVPMRYNPQGGLPREPQPQQTNDPDQTSIKFCYRHRPDVKCRRQANEPSMDQFQTGLASLTQADQQAISHVWSLFSAAPAKHRNLMLQDSYPVLLSGAVLHIGECAGLDQDRLLIRATGRAWLQDSALGRGLNQWSRAITPIPEEVETKDDESDIGEAALDVTSSSAGVKRSAETGLASPESVKRACTRSGRTGQPEELHDSYFSPKRRPWTDVHKDRFKVGTAWKYGRWITKVFRGHINGVMCLQFDDHVLMSGFYDCTVKVWDVNTSEELRTLKGHTSGIRCLQFDDTKLMTGGLDCTIKLWNWRTGQYLRTFQAHTAGIINLHFSGRYVASGSMDRTIRVWDSETKQTYLLRGQTNWVNCVKIDQASRMLLSSSDDLTVRLWDLETRECIEVLEGHIGQVQQVLPMPAEFDLDEDAVLAGDKDDDASSVSSVTQAAQFLHDNRHVTPTPDADPSGRTTTSTPHRLAT